MHPILFNLYTAFLNKNADFAQAEERSHIALSSPQFLTLCSVSCVLEPNCKKILSPAGSSQTQQIGYRDGFKTFKVQRCMW